MIEYIMNEETLDDLVGNCLRATFEGVDDEETRKSYGDEIFNILNAKTTSEKWAKFISSKVFEHFIGEWEQVDGICLWVND